jgi:hypothetical protein
MSKSSEEGRNALTTRVQAALSLTTKKEVASLVNVFFSCPKDGLFSIWGDDEFCLMLTGFGKFIVRQSEDALKF